MTNGKLDRIPDYISHIVSAISRIERYTSGLTQAGFMDNDIVQDAVIRQLEIIGEAARRIIVADPAFTAQHLAMELDAA